MWILALLIACPKVLPPQAPDATSIAVHAPLQSEDAVTRPAPDQVVAALQQMVEARNLALRAEAADAQLTVESMARFSAQISGRYRWNVGVTATLKVGETVFADRFTVPVHLRYSHQREDQAAIEAAPVIARRTAQLIDTWLGLETQDL